MSIFSAIARNLVRKEMQDRALNKIKRFPIEHEEIEIVCKGDWRNTHAENHDLQLMSDRYALCLSIYATGSWIFWKLGGWNSALLSE